MTRYLSTAIGKVERALLGLVLDFHGGYGNFRSDMEEGGGV